MSKVQFWTKFAVESAGIGTGTSEDEEDEDTVYALRKEEFDITFDQEELCKNITSTLVRLQINFPDIIWIRSQKNGVDLDKDKQYVCRLKTPGYDVLGKGRSKKDAIFDGLVSLYFFLPTDIEPQPIRCRRRDFDLEGHGEPAEDSSWNSNSIASGEPADDSSWNSISNEYADFVLSSPEPPHYRILLAEADLEFKKYVGNETASVASQTNDSINEADEPKDECTTKPQLNESCSQLEEDKDDGEDWDGGTINEIEELKEDVESTSKLLFNEAFNQSEGQKHVDDGTSESLLNETCIETQKPKNDDLEDEGTPKPVLNETFNPAKKPKHVEGLVKLFSQTFKQAEMLKENEESTTKPLLNQTFDKLEEPKDDECSRKPQLNETFLVESLEALRIDDDNDKADFPKVAEEKQDEKQEVEDIDKNENAECDAVSEKENEEISNSDEGEDAEHVNDNDLTGCDPIPEEEEEVCHPVEKEVVESVGDSGTSSCGEPIPEEVEEIPHPVKKQDVENVDDNNKIDCTSTEKQFEEPLPDTKQDGESVGDNHKAGCGSVLEEEEVPDSHEGQYDEVVIGGNNKTGCSPIPEEEEEVDVDETL